MQQQQAEAAYQKALRYHQNGKFKEAEALYRKILRHYPKLESVLTNLGSALLSQGKLPQALQMLDKAIRLNPTNMDAYANRAAVLYRQGELEAALQAYRDLAGMDSKNASAHYNLANVLAEMDKVGEAEKSFRQALVVSPDLYQAHFNLGMLQLRMQAEEEALQSFQRALVIHPGYAAAAIHIGNIEMDRGNLGAAEQAYTTAIEVAPKYVLGYQARAKLLLDLGKPQAAMEDLEAAAALDDQDVAILTLRGNALDTLGKPGEAEAMYQRALALDPGNKAAESNLRRLWSKQVPDWHFVMLADVGRNAAYQAAIERAVQAGTRVLDIGTGSGLLAMMAARAGATAVYACEMVPPVAKAAVDIIAANGYRDQITVFEKNSADLVIGAEIPERVDLIVSEILDAALLGEGVLPSLRHAARELAQGSATMIPAGATAWAQLIALPKLRAVNPLKDISGFDLRGFNRFRRPESNLVIQVEQEVHQTLSAPVQVEDFDFMHLPPAVPDLAPKTYNLQFPVTADGTVHAIMIWFDLHLDAEATVSSGVGGDMDHWGQAVCFLPEDLPVTAGQEIVVTLMRTDKTWMTK